MRWQYKISLLLLLISWTVFLIFADNDTTMGHSEIWYHVEHWVVSLLLTLEAVVFSLYGLIMDIKERKLKQSDSIKIKVITEKAGD